MEKDYSTRFNFQPDSSLNQRILSEALNIFIMEQVWDSADVLSCEPPDYELVSTLRETLTTKYKITIDINVDIKLKESELLYE